jgi:uncharacterized protein (TIGR01244 family)
MQARAITPQITVSDQPTEDEIKVLPDQGYVGVINARHDGEPEQPLNTTEEGARVREAGMDYLNVPVGAPPLSEEGVRKVFDFLDRHANGRVLVHCRKGGRAAALVLLHQARARGWKPFEVFDKGEAMGLKVEGKLREAVAQFLAAHPS